MTSIKPVTKEDNVICGSISNENSKSLAELYQAAIDEAAELVANWDELGAVGVTLTTPQNVVLRDNAKLCESLGLAYDYDDPDICRELESYLARTLNASG